MRTSKVFPILSIVLLLVFISIPASAKYIPRVIYAQGDNGPPFNAQYGPYATPVADMGDGPFPHAIPKGLLDIGDEIDGQQTIPREAVLPKWRMFHENREPLESKKSSPVYRNPHLRKLW